jgi:hypothetical protein
MSSGSVSAGVSSSSSSDTGPSPSLFSSRIQLLKLLSILFVAADGVCWLVEYTAVGVIERESR